MSVLKTELPRQPYIVAVSGGIDSVVLVDVPTRSLPADLLTVAHVQHGIRGDDSEADAVFVEQLAKQYGLNFYRFDASLGAAASEAEARDARYGFLFELSTKLSATLVTAHHQDDVLETVLINLVRGSSWRGLAALRDEQKVRRPFLNYTKQQIIGYAREQGLTWREDATNINETYLRNYLRHQVVPRFTADQRQKLVDLHNSQVNLREEIETELARQSFISSQRDALELSRYHMIMLPRMVAKEVLQQAALQLTGSRLQQRQVEQLLTFIKTAYPHKKYHPRGDIQASVNRDTLFVTNPQN